MTALYGLCNVSPVNVKQVTNRLRVRLELRRSNAAVRHTNKARAAKRPGKGNRNNWKRQNNG